MGHWLLPEMFTVQIRKKKKKKKKEFPKSLDMKCSQNCLVLLLRETVVEKYSELLDFGNFRWLLDFIRLSCIRN